ncbi:MAG: Na+/H+ antiporter [Planctomycetes bacterium]|nr:Na+/H+ antiporter [Planctomycetota bacterium]
MPSLDALLLLLAAIALTAIVAPRIRVPLPIALTGVGLALALVPGLPHQRLDPDLVLLGFLPPLLYADAFHTSWVDFRRWLRPILMLAIGLVAVTILTVGLAAHALFPALPWAACFTLGAVLSPTDTVATQAVLARLRIPRRLSAIIGGESLVNDATGLVGVQIGVAVMMTGAFERREVATSFLWVSGGGVAIGAAVGLFFSALNRRVHGTSTLFVLSLVSPYLAALLGLELGCSSVLAVVVAGFIVSWNIHFVAPHSRGPLYEVWDQLVFVLNGFSFLFIGLEAPRLLATCPQSGTLPLLGALGIALVVILTRIAWVFPAAYLPLKLSPRLRDREGGYPKPRAVFLASWCGVRGIVSLAAALSLPAVLEDGTPLAGRELVVTITLVVVLATLAVHGLTLEPLAKRLGLRADPQTEEEVRGAREELLRAGIARLDEFCTAVSCPISVHHLRQAMQDELDSLRERDLEERTRARRRLDVSRDVRVAIHAAQSRALLALRDTQRINDSVYAELQLELDRAQPAEASAT